MANNKLAVYLYGNQIGNLVPTRTGARFSFLNKIAGSMLGSPMLSTALRVQASPFDTLQTRNWFTGLLPEDARLSELCRFFGVPEDDYLAILEELGWECAGAVSVMPGKVAAVAHKISEESLKLSKQELAQRLEALPAHPFDSASTLRVSLGGFQEKLCVVVRGCLSITDGYAQIHEVGMPLDGALSTHILKPQPERFPGMIEGEAWAMAVASIVTPTAQTALLDIEGAPITLMIRRFDRRHDDGKLCRIHQEDCAQAMGLGPLQKYAASGTPKKSDPSYLRIATLLKSYSVDPEEQLKQLLSQMIVNAVLGNTDAHAKNYAYLHPDESTICLAPLYDVVPAREITPRVVDMGMRIGGRIRIDRIGYEQVIDESTSWGLSSAVSQIVLQETLEGIREGITYANKLYPKPGTLHTQPTLKRLESFLS
ncbi:MAG: HipA domain-containing protein [Coriobacteriia bacterium]|nr:HipA domain-containing protein [Coriobacteriia bacterium]